jgi:actin-related protein 5
MAPSAIGPPAQGLAQPFVTRPATLYPVKEAHFESYLKPQPEGYQQAVRRGSDNAAIVIDNGIAHVPLALESACTC